MHILMLGNSFTFYNDMPSMLAELTCAEVVHHTRGGARLAEQLNPETQMGAKTLEALEKESWDYVILQEMSNGPITTRESFMNSVSSLCEKIRAAGATPILMLLGHTGRIATSWRKWDWSMMSWQPSFLRRTMKPLTRTRR